MFFYDNQGSILAPVTTNSAKPINPGWGSAKSALDTQSITSQSYVTNIYLVAISTQRDFGDGGLSAFHGPIEWEFLIAYD